jgi:hypothetical protein
MKARPAVRFLPPLLLIALLAASAVRADVVQLRNGDRLTGTVVAKHENTLVLKTPYAGDVRIQWSEVASLTVDKPVRVMLKGEKTSPATLAPAAPGQVTIMREGREPQPVELTRVEYINPQPYQSGSGVVWRGNVNIAATYTRGNSASDRLYVEAGVEARAKSYRATGGVKVNRVSDEFGNESNSWLLDGSYDRFIRPRHFLYARTSFEHDPAKDLELRAAGGAGYGWQVVETPDRQLSLRGGLDYVSVDQKNGGDERYPALGWGLRYHEWLFERRLQVFHEEEGFWNASDLSDIVLRTRTGLRVPLYTNIDTTAQLNVDWDSATAPGRDPVDSVWLLGLGYKW